jgi:outer membrane protein assembly factor BamB
MLATAAAAMVMALMAAPAVASSVTVAPTVRSFSPASGTIGAKVTINGSGFTGATKVTFNGAKSKFTVKSAAKITATVPAAASTGPIAVTTPGGKGSSATNFTVTPGVALTPTSGPPGSTVTVSGAGFGAFELVNIYFDSQNTPPLKSTSANGTGNFSGVTVTVPVSAAPGTHDIIAVGQHSGFSAEAPLLVNTNWPEYRDNPSHTGDNTAENTLGTSNVNMLTANTPFPTQGAVESSPAVVNGVVYVGSTDGNVYAITTANPPQKLWSFTTGGEVVSSPMVVNGVVYVSSFDGNVYALHAAATPAGQLIWSFNSRSPNWSSPTVVNGVVYVGADTGLLYALNASTGQPIWDYNTGTGDAIHGSPTVVNGVVYVSNEAGDVCAVNASTGVSFWTACATVTGAADTPTVVDGVVYVGASGGTVTGFDASNGRPSGWQYTNLTGGSLTSPAIANGLAYVGSSDDHVYAISTSIPATQAWNFAAAGPTGEPAVANGLVYVGAGDDNVYALEAIGLQKFWNYLTGGPVVSSPAVANGTVYVGSNDKNVYAFALPPAAHRHHALLARAQLAGRSPARSSATSGR